MLAGAKGRRARQEALNGAGGVADTLKLMEKKAEDVAADYLKSVQLQKKIDATAVPALSERARSHLREIRAAQVEGPESVAKAYGALQKDAAAMAEIRSYQEAARARLGSRAYQSMGRGAQVRVPGADTRQLAEVSRTVQTVQQAQATARQVQQLGRGQKPKFTR